MVGTSSETKPMGMILVFVIGFTAFLGVFCIINICMTVLKPIRLKGQMCDVTEKNDENLKES